MITLNINVWFQPARYVKRVQICGSLLRWRCGKYGLLKQMDSEFWTDDEIEIILKIITMKNEMLKKKKIP